jgi:hypothetical protein
MKPSKFRNLSCFHFLHHVCNPSGNKQTTAMKTIPSIPVVFLIFLFTACTIDMSFGDGSMNNVLTREYPLNTGANIELVTSGGSIKVKGEKGLDRAIVDFRIGGKNTNSLTEGEIERLFDELDITVESSANRLYIKYNGSNNNFSLFGGNKYKSVSFDVRVPEEIFVNMRTSGGSLTIDNLVGTHQLKTSGGSIKISNVDGEVDGKTSGGSIRVSDSHGMMNVNTSGGSIRIEDCTGSIIGKTSGGSIRASGLTRVDKLDLKTSGGSITTSFEKGMEMNLYAKGSRVRVADLKDFSGELKKDKIDGRIGNGTTPVSLVTSGGSVTINFN